MYYLLNNQNLRYFCILNIFIFTISVNCDPTALPDVALDEKHFRLKDLSQLNSKDVEHFCKRFDTVLIDVDVIFDNIEAITENDVRTLKRLNKAGKKIFLYKSIIDDNKLYTDKLAGKLQSLGYVDPVKVYSPSDALGMHRDGSLIEKAFVIGDKTFQDKVEELGISIISMKNDTTYKDYYNAYNNTLDDKVNAVIIGFDLNINLLKITQAQRYLKEKKNMKLYVAHRNPIAGNNFYNVWIKKLIRDTNNTKLYIDLQDGMFDEDLLTKLEGKKVLCVLSGSSKNQKFIIDKNYIPLLIGKHKITKDSSASKRMEIYYYVDQFGEMPFCPIDD